MHTEQQLTGRALDEFKTAYFEEFAELLSDDEAKEVALRLLRFMDFLEPSSAPHENSPV